MAASDVIIAKLPATGWGLFNNTVTPRLTEPRVAYFTKGVDPSLEIAVGGLAKLGLTSLVKQATVNVLWRLSGSFGVIWQVSN